MKLLVVCSSLDLTAPWSATPAWWQLLKGLYEVGIDLVVTAYHGHVPEAPWWHAYPDPGRTVGEFYIAAKNVLRGIPLRRTPKETQGREQELPSEIVTRMAQKIMTPLWKSHLARILQAEGDVDAVLLVSVPPNHVRGVATYIRQRFGIPVLFYDGDVPASLPPYRGFATGFRIYPGADIAEFDAVLSNSKGGLDLLRKMGARSTHVLYYAADPQIYYPVSVDKDIDILFYGTTDEYREEWLRTMITLPSRALPGVKFAVRGRSLGDLGTVESLRYVSFSNLRGYISRSRINLDITRQSHATLYGSSTMRHFELAMMGACMVCNPCQGIEEWFEPDKELIVVGSAEEAIDRYQYLLAHDKERQTISEAARTRALGEHTYQHRARQLEEIIKRYL